MEQQNILYAEKISVVTEDSDGGGNCSERSTSTVGDCGSSIGSGGGGGMGFSEVTLAKAQEEFASILARLSPSKVPQFVAWIGEGFGPALHATIDRDEDEADRQLHLIRKEIKSLVPLEACFKSEKIIWPKNGMHADCQPDVTVHVDDFLYDDDEVDKLVEEGQVKKYYCGNCGSKDIKSLVFITHSLNPIQLRYIFAFLLPKLGIPLDDRIVLDIGSRLGGVLYAAALYCPQLKDVIGIEMNKDLCNLQSRIIDSRNMWNKINVVCDDFRSQGKVLAKADIVVMNNVFGFFHDEKEQVDCWVKVKQYLRPKTILIHSPSLWKVAAHLDLPFDIQAWVEQLDTRHLRREFSRVNGFPRDLTEIIEVYRVR